MARLYETQYLHCVHTAVTHDRYTIEMTIKQVIIGTVIGSSVVALTIQRIRADKDLHTHLSLIATSNLHETHTSDFTSTHSKSHKKHSHLADTELSSRKLFG